MRAFSTRLVQLNLLLAGTIVYGSAVAGGWYVAPDYTWTYPDRNIFRGTSSNLGISFGKRLLTGPDLEITYSAQEESFDEGLGAIKRRDLTLGTRWTPDPEEMPGAFLSLGAGAARVAFKKDVYLAPVAYAGLGYRLPLPGFKNVDLLPEARARYTRDSHFPAGDNHAVDGQAVVKIRYSTPLPQPSPVLPEASQEVQVVSRRVSLRDTCATLQPDSPAYGSYQCASFEDADGDGVQDSKDVCRNTIPHVTVDDDGCMVSVATTVTPRRP